MFFPTTSVGQAVFKLENKINEFIDRGSKNLHIAREGSDILTRHGDFFPSIEEIATLCKAVIVHGSRDSKRCSDQHRAFIGNGGLDLPNGIPTTIVDGGFRKKLTEDSRFCIQEVLQTIGGLSEFLWKAMVDMQACAEDEPMAPDRARHSTYSSHLCSLLSMAECVSFEHITLVVSTIYPKANDLLEHVDVMNDSIPGYNRTGTLTMCFLIDSETTGFKLGLQVQVIGTFRKVIRQYLERTRTSSISTNVQDHASSAFKNIEYQSFNSKLHDIAYSFGQSLRNQASQNKIIFEGRKSRKANGVQTYSNHYSTTKTIYSQYRFKAALFCDKEYASTNNIKQMKVLGHLVPSQDISTHVNGFHSWESGDLFMRYLRKTYCDTLDKKFDNMCSATYHQQVMEETVLDWTIFEGHMDKSFVHTAWFIPLSNATFYTFVAVPHSWNVSPIENSKLMYDAWVDSLPKEERDKLVSFQEHFEQQAKLFMKVDCIQVMIYLCACGSFLSFPANLCYHATVSTLASQNQPGGQMKDLLIVYPMESG
jgi:hypothetical protein